MKKIIFTLISFIIFASLFAVPTKAAFVQIDPQGKVVWQVLGYEIGVKSVALNETASSQIALTNNNGKVVLNGVDVTDLKGDLVDISARGDSNDIKIGQQDGKFVFYENGVSAATSYPITIDPIKNQLTLSTDSGQRILSILPYEAAISLIRAKMIDSVDNNRMNLVENTDGQLQYVINGTRNINLFNVAKIDAKVISTVSATDGKIMKVDEPQWLKFFGFLFT